jgi:hypothetical protein
MSEEREFICLFFLISFFLSFFLYFSFFSLLLFKSDYNNPVKRDEPEVKDHLEELSVDNKLSLQWLLGYRMWCRALD